MTKRPHQDDGRHSNSHARKRQQFSSHAREQHRDNRRDIAPLSRPRAVNYAETLSKLPPSLLANPVVSSTAPPSAATFTDGVPDLPPISVSLKDAPFTHKSKAGHNRAGGGASGTSYEELEFIGDAYIELFASRLIRARYGHLPTGQMSQLRELLVKNETLAEYAMLYGFDKRISASDVQNMINDGKGKGNKGFTKVLGDVLEAYTAAIIESETNGVVAAEQWLTALWSAKLIEQQERDRMLLAPPAISSTTSAETARSTYNPEAKAELQRRIQGNETKLDYQKFKDTEELKGAQLGQSRHYIALYLTGWGYERRLLGKGEGKSKVEAGNWAAQEAMWGENRSIVEECEDKLKVVKAQAKARREAERLMKTEPAGKIEE